MFEKTTIYLSAETSSKQDFGDLESSGSRFLLPEDIVEDSVPQAVLQRTSLFQMNHPIA